MEICGVVNCLGLGTAASWDLSPPLADILVYLPGRHLSSTEEIRASTYAPHSIVARCRGTGLRASVVRATRHEVCSLTTTRNRAANRLSTCEFQKY